MKDRGLALVYQDTLLLVAPSKRWIALVYLGTPMVASLLVCHVSALFCVIFFFFNNNFWPYLCEAVWRPF